ncbi:hypothetical protein RF11_12711 [Thelohanellus kitauei]|uniref:Uncharacterized protein n=1 Tax=Thelohanellus kitauei TaxID=669202 RepID=A0A0C2MYI4_THEKT|nr:hypothetical protein RF11_12711 [Thelohanellus kitauei]
MEHYPLPYAPEVPLSLKDVVWALGIPIIYYSVARHGAPNRIVFLLSYTTVRVSGTSAGDQPQQLIMLIWNPVSSRKNILLPSEAIRIKFVAYSLRNRILEESIAHPFRNDPDHLQGIMEFLDTARGS